VTVKQNNVGSRVGRRDGIDTTSSQARKRKGTLLKKGDVPRKGRKGLKNGDLSEEYERSVALMRGETQEKGDGPSVWAPLWKPDVLHPKGKTMKNPTWEREVVRKKSNLEKGGFPFSGGGRLGRPR